MWKKSFRDTGIWKKFIRIREFGENPSVIREFQEYGIGTPLSPPPLWGIRDADPVGNQRATRGAPGVMEFAPHWKLDILFDRGAPQ